MTWRERLLAGDFDLDRAAKWSTCAVGEQAMLHPEVVLCRFVTEPADACLRAHGLRFNRQVFAEDAAGALATLDAIEDLRLVRGIEDLLGYAREPIP